MIYLISHRWHKNDIGTFDAESAESAYAAYCADPGDATDEDDEPYHLDDLVIVACP